ncbi:hypothetical protein CLAFUW4_20074 [Fulvia fulva]|uniref:uncharacterized protein n=1 Tax=Passalora fulva TaxID=5499 RepID=UPI00285264F9|nr:uncharacterized protein CLAFUR5_20074 [Fulvia fulva]KAK4617835.1 hypothetical protein CLAFUR4_20074 [Fulvia fulva]KAK4619270.1 hypothetical protein CLAFUR0_20074 [Fulvia fulva]WMI38989.1 hypothetical protein CLAFUR5_20074 [Fulvia fulva]WPV18351.1 hypothetical protein CLAFUW4_20074 [Fulvia fulva]WPV33158.1 hypothetical protein CLAFUW7_20074 [Fulvia fulva]
MHTAQTFLPALVLVLSPYHAASIIKSNSTHQSDEETRLFVVANPNHAERERFSTCDSYPRQRSALRIKEEAVLPCSMFHAGGA